MIESDGTRDKSNAKSRLAFVVPYTGIWPKWSTLFFSSVEHNHMIDVILVCENPPPFPVPSNVVVHYATKESLAARFSSATGLTLHTVSGHKLCDFRPFFGLAFADFLAGYEFWGYCDIDLVFGDLSKLLTPEFYAGLDVFSAHYRELVGHFTIIRNDQRMNRLGFLIEDWRQLCLSPGARLVDELPFANAVSRVPNVRWTRTQNLTEELKRTFCRYGITFGFWGEVVGLDPNHHSVVAISDGKVFYHDARGRTEVLYVHFMGLKRWWHWLTFRKFPVGAYRFTRIGYGGPAFPTSLSQFPWLQIWLLQRLLQHSKSWSGATMRRLLPASAFLVLRRRIFGSSRY